MFELSARFVCDIAQVIEHFQAILDWPAFVYRTKQLGLQSGIYITLTLTQEWMNITIPAYVLTALVPHALDPQLFLQIKYWLSRSNEFDYNEKISRNVSTFIYAPWFLQKIKVLICQLFASPKKLALIYSHSYPSWRVYFYYFVRFKDL